MKHSTQKKQRKTILLCLTAGVLLFSSCLKTTTSTPQVQLFDIVTSLKMSNASSFTLLVEAISKAGLSDSLTTGNGPYTLFAAADPLFASYYGWKTTADVDKVSIDSIKKIVNYFLIKGAMSTFPTGPDQQVQTSSGYPLYVTHAYTESGVEYVAINGNFLSQTNFPCTNGLIHIVTNALNPPLSGIAGTVSTIPTLSKFNAAVIRAGLTANLNASANTQTLFAPSDSAFTVAGYPTVASINAADPDSLATLVNRHILTGRVFSSDIANATSVASLAGPGIRFTTNLNTSGLPAIALSESGNSTPANIKVYNINTINGVIHIINEVLKPAPATM